MVHLTLQETRDIVDVFPKIPRRLKSALIRAHQYVEQNYNCMQEKLILRQLTEAQVGDYTEARKAVECPFQLFMYLALGNKAGTCAACGKVTCFRTTHKKFQEFCDNTCAAPHVSKRRIEVWRKKYGVDNPSKTTRVRQKISRSVHSYNKSIGKCVLHGTRRRRHFTYQPNLPDYAYVGTGFYVYVLMDPRKPGPFRYGNWKFDYEPFYIGKGHGTRAYDHIRQENISANASGQGARSSHKKSKIRKILKETGDYPIVLIKRANLSEAEAFETEARLIYTIGRSDMKEGPLTNHSDGGEGVSGQRWTNKQKAAHSVRIARYYKEQRHGTTGT